MKRFFIESGVREGNEALPIPAPLLLTGSTIDGPGNLLRPVGLPNPLTGATGSCAVPAERPARHGHWAVPLDRTNRRSPSLGFLVQYQGEALNHRPCLVAGPVGS
jgi:hypothetical protein